MAALIVPSPQHGSEQLRNPDERGVNRADIADFETTTAISTSGEIDHEATGMTRANGVDGAAFRARAARRADFWRDHGSRPNHRVVHAAGDSLHQRFVMRAQQLRIP